MQHRHEDSHAVYVEGNSDGNNAKHRQGGLIGGLVNCAEQYKYYIK